MPSISNERCSNNQENAINGKYQENIMEAPSNQSTVKETAAIIEQTTEVTEEIRRTDMELDTEVSQINTQSNEKSTASTEPAESYSRPMSRTSSLVINETNISISIHHFIIFCYAFTYLLLFN